MKDNDAVRKHQPNEIVQFYARPLGGHVDTQKDANFGIVQQMAYVEPGVGFNKTNIDIQHSSFNRDVFKGTKALILENSNCDLIDSTTSLLGDILSPKTNFPTISRSSRK